MLSPLALTADSQSVSATINVIVNGDCGIAEEECEAEQDDEDWQRLTSTDWSIPTTKENDE